MPPVTRPISNDSTDAVVETQFFWVKHRTEILVGVITILVALAAYGGFRLYTARRDAAAAAMLADAKTPADFQKVYSEYSTAPAAATAYLRLAEAQKKEGKLAEANTTLQGFVAKFPKHEFVASARMGIAANLESLGKADEALETYRRIAAENRTSFNAPYALLAQVPLLKQKGQLEEARRNCETVLTQYRDSRFASMQAQDYLRTLKPKLTPTPAPNAAQATPAQVAPIAVPTPAKP